MDLSARISQIKDLVPLSEITFVSAWLLTLFLLRGFLSPLQLLSEQLSKLQEETWQDVGAVFFPSLEVFLFFLSHLVSEELSDLNWTSQQMREQQEEKLSET